MSSALHGGWARRVRLLCSLLAGTATALCASSGTAVAAPGPAPAPAERVVVADVHTDAVSTFWDDDAGRLELGSRADVPVLGTPYEADDVWFHVDHDSRVASLPPGFAFVAPEGSTVWLAPQAGAEGQLWPGFSTESVPRGTLDGDTTTFTLLDVDGPGEVELWQNGALEVERLWSSDEPGFESFTRARTHLHANWAFTAPGVYDLTVRADATVDGAPVGDTAVYTFVVGEVPTAVPTVTTLAASVTEVRAGDPVTLTAQVSPSDVAGAVEFRTGATVLGHDPVGEAGTATLTMPDLAVGTHEITARFAPKTSNLANGSVSQPVRVVVLDESGVPFGVAGVEESYAPGDTLTATVAGITLADDQRLRWHWRVAGDAEPDEGVLSQTFSRELSASDDGYELAASMWDCEEWDLEYCEPEWSEKVAQTPWVPVTVGHLGDPIVAELTTEATARYGSTATIAISGRELAAGETLQLVRRAADSAGKPWGPSGVISVLEGGTASIFLEATGEFAVRVLDEHGLAVSQSEAITITVEQYEVQIAGVRGVYRPGATLRAQGIVHPEDPGLRYTWSFMVPSTGYYRVLSEGSGAEALTAELPDLTLDHHGGALFLVPSVRIGAPFVEEPQWIEPQASQANVRVNVVDVEPGVQIFQLQPLGEHYHQGNPIHLVLGADPLPADGDEVVWEWRWPGAEWAELPGASGLSHTLTAEQALDGVQVRATLDYAGEEAASVVAGPVTIRHDDHGAPPRQQPTVAGDTTVSEGDEVRLTRELPANGSTVPTGHRWEKRVDGGEWTGIAGATGPVLSFRARAADHGTSYRVAILKPGGQVAYGPSLAVGLVVDSASEPSEPDTDPVADAELTAETAGEVELAGGGPVRPGSDVSVAVGKRYAGTWVSAWLHPGPVWLGWVLVDDAGAVRVTLPADAAAGDRRLVVKSRAGDLLGWTGLRIESPPGPRPAVGAVATSVTAAGVRQVYGRTAQLTVLVAPQATGPVVVTVGAQSVTGTLSGGRAVVRLPARALTPGSRTVGISYAGSDGFAASTGAASVRVVRAAPRVEVAVADRRVGRGATTKVRVTVTADGVRPTGSITVQVAGRPRTVPLRNGRATVKVRVPATAEPGAARVSVAYAGTALVGRGTARTGIRISG